MTMSRTMAITARALQALALALSLVACGKGPGVPRIAALDSNATILAFGDSLTFGTGSTHEHSYPAALQHLIGRKVVNAGVPGETTEQGLERLPGVLDATEPALVLLCLGGNDMLRKQDRARMQHHLDLMIELIRARGLAVILLGVPEPRLLGLKTEAIYFELARRHQIPLESAIIPEVLGDRARKSDPIHPNAAGYADMARAIAALLRETGAID